MCGPRPASHDPLLTPSGAKLAHEVHDVRQIRDRSCLRDLETHRAGTQVVRLQLVDEELQEPITAPTAIPAHPKAFAFCSGVVGL
jgi:hypothetical protein